MTNNMLLDISQIRLDGGTQIRAGLDESVVAEYAEHLPSLPPVRVLHDGTNFWLTDGFHRIAAHLRVGHTNCNVVFETPGQREDAVELACGANSTHGLPRTPDDKRRAVEALLKLEKWKTKSDREVAKQCGVGYTLVGDVRAKLSARGGQSPQVREITRNGKTVQLDTTYIGLRPAAPPPAPEAPQRVEAPPAPVVRPRADEAPRWPAERPREAATPPKESAQQRTVPLPMVQDVVPTSKPKQSTATTLVSWEALSHPQRVALLEAAPRDSSKGFNKQDNDSIEWAQWSWNPVTGCLHNCVYCYARDIANRFFEHKFEPAIIPERIHSPRNVKPCEAETNTAYKNVFVCSMADLFGRWVPSEWINAVLNVVRETPEWNFLLLTKFPNRYAEFSFPDNAWIGTSVDCQARVKNAEKAMAAAKAKTKWLSCEPLIEPLQFKDLSIFKWMVIGGSSPSSQTPAWIPPRPWVHLLEVAATTAGCMVYEKANLADDGRLERLRQYPWAPEDTRVAPEALHCLKGKTT